MKVCSAYIKRQEAEQFHLASAELNVTPINTTIRYNKEPKYVTFNPKLEKLSQKLKSLNNIVRKIWRANPSLWSILPPGLRLQFGTLN